MIKHLHFLFASIIMLAFGMNASAQDVVTFTFNEANSYEQFGLKGWSKNQENNLAITDGDIEENKTITSGDVTFTVTPCATGGTTCTRMYQDYNGNYGLRTYDGTQIIISSTKNIAKIEFGSKKFKFTAEAGTLTGTVWEPTGDMTTATFNCYKSSTTETVTVTLAAGGSVDPTPEATEIYSVVFDSKEAVDSWTKEGGMAKYKDFATFDAGKVCVALNQYMDNGTTYFISPAMTLGEGNNTVSFENTEFGFENDDAAAHTDLVIRTTDGAAWEKIEGAKFGNNWKEFISSGDLAVPAKYNGKEVQFAFECRFNQDPTGGSGYLYVKNFKVMNGQGATPDPEPQPTEPVVILEESFATSLGDFTTEGEKIWFWSQDNKCMMMGAFGAAVNDGSYLVSPTFCVAEQGTVSFRHSVGYDWMGTIANNAGFYIRTVGGEWTKIDGLTFPMSMEFGGTAMDVTLDIPAEFYNKNVQVAFGYKTAGDQVNWFVNNFVVKGIPGTAEPVDPQPTETIAENIAAFNALCVKDGVDVTFNLVDAQVLYVNEYTNKGKTTQEVFVRDATGSMMFYNAGMTVKAGDIMNGSVKGSAKDFYGTKEFCATANTDFSTVVITEGEAVAAEKTISEITDAEVSNLVLVRNVTMISKEETDSKGKTRTNYYLVDENGNELSYYNKFKKEGLDAKDFIGKESHIFIGVLKLDYGKIQLCPTEAAVPTGIDCIQNVELDVNAPMYNVAGQKVNANYKGIVLQNGKKFINK